MFPKNRWLLIHLVVVSAITLIACQPQTVETVVTQQVEVTRIVDGEPVIVTEQVEVVVTATPEPAAELSLPLESIRIPANVRMNSLDPTGPGQLTQNIVLNFICGYLYKLNTDWSAKPELADGLPEISADGLTATVKLKPGLVYSDGSPVVAQDVVFALERQQTAEATIWGSWIAGIESAEAPDDTTVVFHLTGPSVDLPIKLGHPGMCVLPQSQIEADPDFFTKAPIGAGQYILQPWSPADTSWTLVENPDYALGASAVRQIEFTVVADPTSRVLQLATGELDYAYDIPLAARDSFPPDVQTYVSPLGGMYQVLLNQSFEPFTNRDVRLAMSLALNREEISQKAFGGISAPATSWEYPAVVASGQGLENLPNGGKQDLEAARELLATTPYADGFEFELLVWSSRAGWPDATVIVAENLAEIGITAKVTPIDEAVGRQRQQQSDFQGYWTGNTGDPLSLLINWFHPNGTFQEQVGWTPPPEMLAAMDAAVTAATLEERTELLHEIQDYAVQEMPYLIISERSVLVAQRVPREIVFENTRPPGNNITVALLSDLEN